MVANLVNPWNSKLDDAIKQQLALKYHSLKREGHCPKQGSTPAILCHTIIHFPIHCNTQHPSLEAPFLLKLP